jgi:hypothetical protein
VATSESVSLSLARSLVGNYNASTGLNDLVARRTGGEESQVCGRDGDYLGCAGAELEEARLPIHRLVLKLLDLAALRIAAASPAARSSPHPMPSPCTHRRKHADICDIIQILTSN